MAFPQLDPAGTTPAVEFITIGGFNGDEYADLAIGIPQEYYALGGFSCGAVSVVFGSASGLVTDGNQLWDQDSPGIEDQCDGQQYFGSVLAALPPVGLFLDDFETGDLVRWSGTAP